MVFVRIVGIAAGDPELAKLLGVHGFVGVHGSRAEVHNAQPRAGAEDAESKHHGKHTYHRASHLAEAPSNQGGGVLLGSRSVSRET